MVFDGHSDLLYDVTRLRMAGENRVLECHHLDRLKKGGVEGMVLAIWTSFGTDTFWKEYHGTETAAARTELMMLCARIEFMESPWLEIVRTSAGAEQALKEGRMYAFLAVEGMEAIDGDLSGIDRYVDFGARIGMLTWNEETTGCWIVVPVLTTSLLATLSRSSVIEASLLLPFEEEVLFVTIESVPSNLN